MKIDITPIERFEVKVDGRVIGEFTKVSEWEGFAKLRGENGVIIVSDESSFADKLFDGILGHKQESNYKVIKCTPGLI